MVKNELTIYCDGGSRGNPGPAACAFVVMNSKDEIDSGSLYLGNNTNNVAEYNALLMSMKWIFNHQQEYKDYKISIIMDSQLVVRQINGVYKIKNKNLKDLAREIFDIRKQIGVDVEVLHVLRSKNKLADKLVNEKLDE